MAAPQPATALSDAVLWSALKELSLCAEMPDVRLLAPATADFLLGLMRSSWKSSCRLLGRTIWAREISGRSGVPTDFKRDIVQFLLRQDSSSECAHAVAWLELTVMAILEGVVRFPAQGVRNRWAPHYSATCEQPLTLAVQFRLFRGAAREVLRSFGLEALLREHLSLMPLGFSLRVDGLRMGLDSVLWFRARETLAHFAGGRIIRAAAGLARHLAAH